MDQALNTAIADKLLEEAGISPATLIQLLPVAACLCDASHRFICCNQSAVALLGKTPAVKDVLFNNNLTTIFNPENGPMPDNWQDTILRPDNSIITVRGSITPLKDKTGAVTGWLYCFREVFLPDAQNATTTPGSHLNEELKQSKERYYKMIEEVEDYAILLLDRSGVIQNWNKGAEKIKGYQESEIIGQHFSVFYLPEDRAKKQPEKLITEAIRTGKAVQEGWRMRKNGTRFWGSIVITALHDNEQRVIGFSKVTRDLTEKKIAEDRIRQYAGELEFQNRELEQFAYAAAHDMKEPLRKIQFYNNYIFDNAADTLPEKSREYLIRSINAASRMHGLIDDLLTYSRASSQPNEMKMIDLKIIVEEVLQSYSETIKSHQTVVTVGVLPLLHIIPFQFSQLFDNLISNALKYHHPDRIPRISITAEKTQLPAAEITGTEIDTPCYKITVADNGLGFEPGHADKIFDVFQRLHARPDISGSGIGLAICKKIVLNHHGIIRAHGIPGEGASFDIYIPCDHS
ncbi:PAS domain S-box protein [Chitinophaga rhizophila]|uniref:histidine kinase n=1 Tax=Chitinophaga rhizophila TaxID=2866212 RepID=A0ABS7GKU7_9BACT|nr:PAS domain S-box protein [Chitinophaga rhizophila]MBW8688361.1 PAS domain S-box protein [Chitinophaga rhizophila]